MVYTLAQSAGKHWRKLNGADLLLEVAAGVEFVDGTRKAAWPSVASIHDF